jgi:hypothetical protein
LIVRPDEIPTVLSVAGEVQPIGQDVLYETAAICVRVAGETATRGVVEARCVQ